MTRNAAGRFAAAPAEVPKRSAGERLQLVKLGIKARERERDELTAQWRQSLLNDDERAAAHCEHQLDELEWKLRRCQALIDLLPPQIAREREQQQRSEWPTSLEAAQAQLLVVAPEIERRQAVPRVDRSARFDAELDSLVNQQYRLLRLIESFAPKEMTAR